MTRAIAWVICSATLLTGCDATSTLFVDIRTDYDPGIDFSSVRVTALRSGQVLAESDLAVSEGDTTFFAGRRVAEFSGLEHGPLLVEVELMSGDTLVDDQPAVLDFDSDRAVTVVLSRACAGVECPRPGGDPTLTACEEGICVDPCVDDRCEPPLVDATAPDVIEPPDTSVGCSAGDGCDDGDACTHGDICDASGGCEGTLVACTDDICTTRTCNGTSVCTETPRDVGTTCDDGNPCTVTACDGEGTCVAIPVNTDGTAPDPSMYEMRCCGQTIVNIITDQRHCGGCWIDCEGRDCVGLGFGAAACACPVSNAACRTNGGPTWTCFDHGTGFGHICNCQSDADCSNLQSCVIAPGPNICVYD